MLAARLEIDVNTRDLISDAGLEMIGDRFSEIDFVSLTLSKFTPEEITVLGISVVVREA